MDYHSVIEYNSINFFILLISPTATTVLILLTLGLFFLSFLIAGSEMAFFSLTLKEINLLKTKRQPSYRRVVTLLEQPKILSVSILITNTIINIAIILILNILINSIVGNWLLNFWLTFLLKIFFIGFCLLLFSKVLPRVWAAHHKVWFASMASLIIEIFNSLLYRISKRMVKFSDKIEKKNLSDKRAINNNNRELDYAIDLLPEEEATTEEKRMLKGIRNFGDTTVKQIMRTRLDVNGLSHNLEFKEILKKAEELHYSRLPVYKTNLDEIIGILHTKDLLPYLNEENSYDWNKLMRTPYFVHEQKLIEDLLQEFRNKRMHFAVVVDEFGGTSGIVTLEDIMEEIIGEIKDEFDDEESSNKKIDDNTYIFEGKTMINDVCKTIGIPLDSFDNVRDDSDSLAGLVLEIAGEFPQINEEIVDRNYVFRVLEINKNRIIKVQVEVKSYEK